MSAEDIRKRLEQEVVPILIRRIIAGTVVWVVGVSLIGVAEILQGGGWAWRVQAVRAAAISALILQGMATRHVRSFRGAVLAASAGVTIIVVLTATVGALRASAEPRLFLYVSLMLGTAALLPWGPRAQILASSITTLGYVLNAVLINAHLSGAEIMQLLIIIGASVFIANELEQQRLSAISVRQELEHGERVLQLEAAASNILARAGQELIASIGTVDLLQKLTEFTANALTAPTSHTFLLEPDDDVFVAIGAHGSTVEEWEALRVLRIPRTVVEGLLEQLARDDLIEVDLSSASPAIPKRLTAPYGIEAAVVVPLRRGGELIGILTAGFREPRSLTMIQQRVARGVAHMASLALENVRLLEEVQSANRLKSEFVATMSHELRTPLNIILGYGSLLRDGEFGDMNEEQAHIMRLLDQNARQLLELINATLDLSRLEAGRVPIDIQEVDVAEVVYEVANELQPLADEKLGLQFVPDVAPDLGEVHTDRAKLKLILKNLIGNAYKYSDEGVIEVRVSGSSHWIDVAVSDCGPGIAPELRPHIFEAFRQGSSGLSRTHGGVGLGLYIVVRLLELLGGSITVSSELGEGSRFDFRFPRSPRTRATERATSATVPSQPVPSPRYLSDPARR